MQINNAFLLHLKQNVLQTGNPLTTFQSGDFWVPYTIILFKHKYFFEYECFISVNKRSQLFNNCDMMVYKIEYAAFCVQGIGRKMNEGYG